MLSEVNCIVKRREVCSSSFASSVQIEHKCELNAMHQKISQKKKKQKHRDDTPRKRVQISNTMKPNASKSEAKLAERCR